MPDDMVETVVAALLAGEPHAVEYAFGTSAPGQPEWRVRRMSLEESISGLYRLEVELGTELTDAEPAALLGKNATLRWTREGARAVHGVVHSVRDGASTPETRIVHVEIVPALAVLAHVTHSRIFADVTLVQVVEAVLKEALAPFGREAAFELAAPALPAREYVTQHRESDLTFVLRLLAEQGLFSYFDHPLDEGAVERLVVTDTPGKAPPIDRNPELELARDGERAATHESVTSFAALEQLRGTGQRVRQYNWTHPELIEESVQHGEEPAGVALEAYDHGDTFSYEYQEPRYRKHDVEAQALLRLERTRTDRRSFRGRSNATRLRPGHFVRLNGADYLVTRAFHHGDCLTNTDQSGLRGDYENEFECVLREPPYRPRRRDKPRIYGVQTATVVDRTGKIAAPSSGASGEDIATDIHGRVRVKFPWDLTERGAGGTTSCFLRVAQAWAGAGWGAQFIPRVGMEVIVQFVDGDPDRPLITGCVYNGLNPPPYAGAPTQSGFKTASSVDPSRFNELRFEDAKDREQIFVRAQRDYVEHVLHDHTTRVGHDQAQTVDRNQTELVKGAQSLTVSGKRIKQVGQDGEQGEEITIHGQRVTTVTRAHRELFQDDHEVTVTKNVLEAYESAHDRTVGGTQTFVAKADKLEHVAGRYELTSDRAFVLKQAGTQLAFEGERVQLDAAGAVEVNRGPARLKIDAAGNVTLATAASIKLEVGPNSIAISASGIEVNATAIAASAGPSALELTPAGAAMKGVNTSLEATAVCQIRGLMVGLN